MNFALLPDENVQESLSANNSANNLNIIIQGLALSYLDDAKKQWKIFLPKAPNHNFKMVVRKREMVDGEPSRVIEQNTFELFRAHRDLYEAGKIEIISDQKNDITELNSLRQTIDLFELHGEPITLIEKKNKYAGFLLLNQTVLAEPTDITPMDSAIWRTTPFPEPQLKEFVRSMAAGTIFNCGSRLEPGSKTEIRITSKLGFSIVLEHEENVVHEIVFDNDCHIEETSCAESDFKFYYRIIDESKLVKKQRFELLPIIEGDEKAPVGSCTNGRISELKNPDALF